MPLFRMAVVLTVHSLRMNLPYLIVLRHCMVILAMLPE